MPPQDDIQPLLEKVKSKDLYEFLKLNPRATPRELCEAAKEEFNRVQNQGLRGSPWDERKQLAGICRTVFRDDSSKHEYDRTLKTRPGASFRVAAVWFVVIGGGLYGLSAVGVVPDFGFWRSPTPDSEVGAPPAGGDKPAEAEDGSEGRSPDDANPSPGIGDDSAVEAVERGLGLDRAAYRRVQAALSAQGFDPGPADGVFGLRTREALRGWQRAHGLQATGYLDQEAAERLRNWAAPEPGPAPALVDTGGAAATLNVRGDPSSTIYVNNALKGVVPASGVLGVSNVGPGEHFVVARRDGYLQVTRVVEVAGDRAQVVDVSTEGMPARLTASADVPGAVLRIGNAAARSLPVTDLEIPPGAHDLEVSRDGYRSIADRVDVRPGQLVSRDFILEAIPQEEQVRAALAPAEAQFRAQNYRAAVDALRPILDVVGSSPRANWMLGAGLYELGEFPESVTPLARAIALGADVVLPAKHRHGGGGFREGFCEGTLTLSLTEVAFASFDAPDHGFAVAPDKVAEPTITGSVGGFPFRLNTSVRDPERGIERNNFDFVHRNAVRQTAPEESLRMIVLGCPDCDGSLHVQEALMTILIRSANR